jgi:hypothetical protein
MNNSMFPSHPWRSRSREFAAHLTQLAPDAQHQIKAAERRFLAQREDPTGFCHRIVHDFAESMVGVREEVDTE